MIDSKISQRAFIGENVNLGSGVSVGPGAVILGPCKIEDDVFIGAGAQIGAPPEMADKFQNTSWSGEICHAGVEILKGAVVRENAVIHQGTYRPTTVGQRSWILNSVYIAHDVILGNDTTISAGVSIGGHSEIGRFVNIGMNASIHQRVTISDGCMVGMLTPVSKDLPPFAKVYGSPARIRDINLLAMQKLGIPENDIRALLTAYQNNDIELFKSIHPSSVLLKSCLTLWRARNKQDLTKVSFRLNSEESTETK